MIKISGLGIQNGPHLSSWIPSDLFINRPYGCLDEKFVIHENHVIQKKKQKKTNICTLLAFLGVRKLTHTKAN